MRAQTAQVRSEERETARALREHVRDCPTCTVAQRDRRWDDMCHSGAGLRAWYCRLAAILRADLVEGRETARDQGALF